MKIDIVKDNVKEFLNKYSIENKRVLIAFSGGNDSLTLLSVLLELKDELNLDLIAIHLNHNWRGEESLKEAEICEKFCINNGVKFYLETLSDTVKCTETSARDARYSFFYKCAEKFDSDIIFTAHNADDNAETLLYRIVKGTGIKGLCGIAPVRDIFYRPLLTTYRSDIEKYILSKNLKPNQDSSNINDKYKRNFLRLRVIPELEKINKNLKQSINTLSLVARDSEDIVEEYIKSIKEPYKTRNFLNLSCAVQKRLIYNLITDNDFDYDNKLILKLQRFILENAALKNGKIISLSDKAFLFVSKEEIRLVNSGKKQNFGVKIDKEGAFEVGNYRFIIKKCENIPKKFPPDSECIAYVNLSESEFSYTLRTRQDGDIIQPLGCSGIQKIKKYLNEKGIAKDLRDKMLFLCKENEVLWAPSLGISEKIKVVDKCTHILKLERKNG